MIWPLGVGSGIKQGSHYIKIESVVGVAHRKICDTYIMDL